MVSRIEFVNSGDADSSEYCPDVGVAWWLSHSVLCTYIDPSPLYMNRAFTLAISKYELWQALGLQKDWRVIMLLEDLVVLSYLWLTC